MEMAAGHTVALVSITSIRSIGALSIQEWMCSQAEEWTGFPTIPLLDARARHIEGSVGATVRESGQLETEHPRCRALRREAEKEQWDQ